MSEEKRMEAGFNALANMGKVLGMANNYNTRKVDNTTINEFLIDTCFVDDYGNYETGIQSENFDDGNWVIVEVYATKEEAIEGHKNWVIKVKKCNELKDVRIDETFKRKNKK